ncbi:hypothetical protein DICSQDRAFT_175023 [Dichomitus squalens LYAD-421 SS1]|uniref:Polysaccharide lyase 14 domain-containing protein n=1 Tax=Dichomitus squalens (strain LYAD-421) TaxID=732165 RepID=R7SKM4_DICSQ|nr:uncharacterized protein DICSQDRAFT_175023 [Dichomitus squalens LYAD-421 SS1]EJF56285.1 hypothetical protein DICSQDRAFT_175023 [Dichomitus squalens LYAD-421 SS1]
MLPTFAFTLALVLSSVSAVPHSCPVQSSNNASASASSDKTLFPILSNDSWSVSSQIRNALPFNDATLRPTKEAHDYSHPYVSAPDGVYSIKAFYPKGSYNPSGTPRGGLSFYAPGPQSVDLTTAREATLTYSVLFEEGFDFVKGGKLPGLYGGNSDEEAYSCSGGRRDDGCFSVRFMWRTAGAGELYTYLPPDAANNKAHLGGVKPMSTCNPTYGCSVGRGSFKFAAGTRTIIGERVRLNDVGQQNGELELFVNGRSIFTVTGLTLRTADSGRIRGIQMQTFFGGSDASWATPKDVNSYFGDFSVAITEQL